MTRGFLEAHVQETRVGFPMEDVERVVRAVALHALPAPRACLAGAMDVAGELVTVYDTRRLLGLPVRPLRTSDCIVIARHPKRCGLLVDAVTGMIEAAVPQRPDAFALHATGVQGVLRTADGVLLVQDLRRLLAFERAIPIVSVS